MSIEDLKLKMLFRISIQCKTKKSFKDTFFAWQIFAKVTLIIPRSYLNQANLF